MEMRENNRSMEGWSEKLTPEIWGEIGKRLETRLDIVRFRSVCKSWRSNLPPPSLFPLRIPPPPGLSLSSIFRDPHKTHFFLTKHTGYTIHGCSNPPPPPPPPPLPPPPPPLSKDDRYHDHDRDLDLFPIVLILEDIDEKGGGNKFSPLSLFATGRTPFAKLLRMDQLSLSSVFKSYQLRMASVPSHPTERWNFRKFHAIDKIVLVSYLFTSNPTTNATFTSSINPNYYAGEADVAVVALLSGGLSVLRLPPMIDRRSNNNNNNSSLDQLINWEWEPITSSPEGTRFDDIVSYNGMVIGVDFDGAAFVMNYKTLEMTQIAPSPIHRDSEGRNFVQDRHEDSSKMTFIASVDLCRKRLVETSGSLYLLVPCRVRHQGDDSKSKIMIFQLKLQQDRRRYVWVEVKSLISDNHALFVGRDFCFSTPVARDVFTKTRCNVGNCVFLHGFTFCRNSNDNNRDYPLFPEMRFEGPPLGVYSFEDAKYTRITRDNFPEILYSKIPSCLSWESRSHRKLRDSGSLERKGVGKLSKKKEKIIRCIRCT